MEKKAKIMHGLKINNSSADTEKIVPFFSPSTPYITNRKQEQEVNV